MTGDGTRFAALATYREALTPWAFSSLDAQAVLWRVHTEGLHGAGLGISAFPSMHVATATLWVLVARSVCRPLLPLALAFWVVVTVGSVHLAWHYAVDGYFATGLVLVLWWIFQRDRSQPRASAQSVGRV